MARPERREATGATAAWTGQGGRSEAVPLLRRPIPADNRPFTALRVLLHKWPWPEPIVRPAEFRCQTLRPF